MKLKVNMKSLEVNMFSENDRDLGLRSNGQHDQLPGYILVDTALNMKWTAIKLCHPQTEAHTGHVDVTVMYRDGGFYFHRYSGNERISLNSDLNSPDSVWPTGPWCLLQTVVAVERYLSELTQFEPMVQNAALRGASLPQQAIEMQAVA
ncbi:MAG: hypothetical protein M3Q80_00600 [bacterium]|nr:hypothetical protein [bacterium]